MDVFEKQMVFDFHMTNEYTIFLLI